MTRRPPLVLIFGITLTGILSNSVISPALPDILDEFGQDDSRAGILVAAGSLPGIVMAPLIGFAADRFGRKAVLLPCLASFGIFGLLAATAQSFEFLLVARVAMGLGSAGLINLAVVLIGDNWTGTERTALVGRNAAVLTVGLAVVPLMSGVITEVASWRWALGIYILALASAVVTAFTLENERPLDPGSVRQQVRSAGDYLRMPIILSTLTMGFLLFAMIFGLALATLPLHLEDDFGLSAGWRGAVIAIPALSSTLISSNISRFRSRWGLRGTVVISSGAITLAFVVMGLAGVLLVLIAALVLYGMGEGGVIPSLQDVAVSVPPDEQRGGVLAVWVGAVRLGQTIGPLLATPLIAAVGTGPTLVVGGLLGVVAIAIASVGPIDDATLESSTA